MQTAPRTRPIHRVLRTTCVLLATVLAGACSENARSTVESSLPGGSVPGGSAPGGSAPGGSSVPGRPSNGVPGPTASVPVPTEVIDGFDDHTVSAIASVAEFHALARSGVSGQSAVKFSIPTMATATDVRWMDSNFYSLHDEWYWFRLLNGRSVSGFTTEPVDGPAFETVEEIVEWASRQPGPLPLDLRFIDSRTHGRRLYSDEFYPQGVPSDTRN